MEDTFKTGQMLIHKDTGAFAVVINTYAQKYGGDDHESLHVVWLNAFGHHGHESAWHNASSFVPVPFEEMVLFAALHSDNTQSHE